MLSHVIVIYLHSYSLFIISVYQMHPSCNAVQCRLKRYLKETLLYAILILVLQDSQLRHFSQPSALNMNGEDSSEAIPILSEAIPIWPWFVFLAGAMACLVCSSLSHLLACHSQRFNFFFWRLDYAGISLMIICSFFAPIYYAFSCHPYSRLFYLTSISLLGFLVIVTLLAPALSAPRFRSFRATLFLSMGFLGVIPAVHAVVIHRDHPQIFVALGFEMMMAVMYAAGAGFYVSRFPERWKPGAFDIAGHSHQIFHVFVVAGALAHSAATLVLLNWRQGLPNCDVSPSVLTQTWLTAMIAVFYIQILCKFCSLWCFWP